MEFRGTDTSSYMEFHGTWSAPISMTRAVPWNSKEFRGTWSAPISLTPAVPWNSMEFYGTWSVPNLLTRAVPWNSWSEQHARNDLVLNGSIWPTMGLLGRINGKMHSKWYFIGHNSVTFVYIDLLICTCFYLGCSDGGREIRSFETEWANQSINVWLKRHFSTRRK